MKKLYNLIKKHFSSRYIKECYKREWAIKREFICDGVELEESLKDSEFKEKFMTTVFRYVPNAGQILGLCSILTATSTDDGWYYLFGFEFYKLIGYMMLKFKLDKLRDIITSKGHFYMDENLFLDYIQYQKLSKSDDKNEKSERKD